MTEQRDSILIRNAKLVDKRSPFHLKTMDVHIEHGVIKEIGKNLKEKFGMEVISGKDLHLSIGWFDLHVNVQDPGYEYKETIESALKAAAAGGFSGVLSCSTTIPAVDHKSAVEYQLNKSKGQACELFVSGCLSQQALGRELAELYDMKMAGARAFYDYKSNVENSQLLKLALLYTKSFDGLVMCQPGDKYLNGHGMVHEGRVSTSNGLKGIPTIAEDIGVERMLKILEYTGHKIHFSALSSPASVKLVKQAKKKGLGVSAGVSSFNLMYTDQEVSNFDSNFKLMPPLRDKSMQKSLISGLLDGSIDVVISDHWPQNIESKDCEFENAGYGMINLETSFAILNTALEGRMSSEDMIELLAVKPREILGLEIPLLDVGQKPNLTLYQPSKKWTYNVSDSLSVSRNSGLDGREFIGSIVGVIRGGTYQLNN
ncbi:MAG: dihydroorotase [Vicingaceae bacterium]